MPARREKKIRTFQPVGMLKYRGAILLQVTKIDTTVSFYQDNYYFFFNFNLTVDNSRRSHVVTLQRELPRKSLVFVFSFPC